MEPTNSKAAVFGSAHARSAKAKTHSRAPALGQHSASRKTGGIASFACLSCKKLLHRDEVFFYLASKVLGIQRRPCHIAVCFRFPRVVQLPKEIRNIGKPRGCSELTSCVRLRWMALLRGCTRMERC